MKLQEDQAQQSTVRKREKSHRQGQKWIWKGRTQRLQHGHQVTDRKQPQASTNSDSARPTQGFTQMEGMRKSKANHAMKKIASCKSTKSQFQRQRRGTESDKKTHTEILKTEDTDRCKQAMTTTPTSITKTISRQVERSDSEKQVQQRSTCGDEA